MVRWATLPSLTQVEERIGGVEPDSLTPRSALELLYELKRLVEERKRG